MKGVAVIRNLGYLMFILCGGTLSILLIDEYELLVTDALAKAELFLAHFDFK